MYPDTYPDLFAAYAIIWACLFLGLCFLMSRNWTFDRELKKYESEQQKRASLDGR